MCYIYGLRGGVGSSVERFQKSRVVYQDVLATGLAIRLSVFGDEETKIPSLPFPSHAVQHMRVLILESDHFRYPLTEGKHRA